MKGRFWLSGAAAALGSTLLLAAAFAGSATGSSQGPSASDRSERAGGTWRILLNSDFDHWDPALAYFTHTWNMGTAAQLRMYYYPMVNGDRNKQLTPMAATGMPRVSNNGRTYTITIKRGFRFSNGAQVTAQNFARSLARGKNAKLQSPAASFLDDVAGWRVTNNYTLTIRLNRVAPDFTARLTMPFFSAILPNTPLDEEVTRGPFHSAGPYYVREWNKGSSALAVRNPFWRNNQQPFRAFGFPLNVDQIRWQVVPNLATQRLMCDRNEADICGAPPAQWKEIADAHGINRGRFRVVGDITAWRLDMNNEQPLFRGNSRLRQAVSHAIDRRFMIAQHGYLAGRRTDQFLPYPMPGFRDFNIYSLRGPNLAQARTLAQGNTRSGRAVMYVFNTGAGPGVAQSVQFNLRQIGLDVEIRQFDRVVQNTKAATRGEPFDMTVEGWHADYPDPSNFINVLLDGRRLQAENNVNSSYYSGDGVPNYARRLDQAYAATGQRRFQLYQQLDRDVMRSGAPSAVYNSANNRFLLGPDAGCWTYSPQSGHALVGVCKTR
jgi:peptide/nickel transport system substrate-binding protein